MCLRRNLQAFPIALMPGPSEWFGFLCHSWMLHINIIGHSGILLDEDSWAQASGECIACCPAGSTFGTMGDVCVHPVKQVNCVRTYFWHSLSDSFGNVFFLTSLNTVL